MAEFEDLVPSWRPRRGLLLLGVPVTAMRLIAGAVVPGGMAV